MSGDPGRMAIGSGVLLLLFLAAWEWGPGAIGIPPYILPPASDVYAEAVRMTGTDRLFDHTLTTALQVVVGFLLGALLGFAVGVALGMSPAAEFILSPYILALQIAPKVAFAPLFILWFGYTATPKILVAVLIVFFPVMINVLGAMRSIDPDVRNLARAFTASRLQLFWKVEFPGVMPELFAGLRIAATLAVIGIVVGEFVGGNSGLGYLLVFGEGSGNTAMVFVSIIFLTVIGILLYGAVVLAERRVLHYMPSRQSGS